ARLHCRVAGCANRARRKLRRPAALDLSKGRKLSLQRDVFQRRHCAEADSFAQVLGAAKKKLAQFLIGTVFTGGEKISCPCVPLILTQLPTVFVDITVTTTRVSRCAVRGHKLSLS